MFKICELCTVILWYELSPRVRCAFGNVHFHDLDIYQDVCHNYYGFLQVNIVMFLLPGLLMTLCYSLIVAKLYRSAGLDILSKYSDSNQVASASFFLERKYWSQIGPLKKVFIECHLSKCEPNVAPGERAGNQAPQALAKKKVKTLQTPQKNNEHKQRSSTDSRSQEGQTAQTPPQTQNTHNTNQKVKTTQRKKGTTQQWMHRYHTSEQHQQN